MQDSADNKAPASGASAFLCSRILPEHRNLAEYFTYQPDQLTGLIYGFWKGTIDYLGARK